MSEITILTDPDRAVLDCAGIIAAVCPAYRSDTLLFSIEHDAIPLSDVRALIAAWDRAQGALPELPPGYVVEESGQGDDSWLAFSPDALLSPGPDFDPDIAAASARCWTHFAAMLDPKWAQLLRNAGLSV